MSRKKLPTPPPPEKTTAQTLAEEKLASSGLTLEDAKALGIEVLTGSEVLSLDPGYRKYNYAALKFIYRDPNGADIRAHTKAAPFHRLRFLEAPKVDPTAAALTGKKAKPLRYVQPPETPPYPYYPSNQSWPELLADPTKTLIITEGELKAAKACKEGFPTIGLGGVWSWRAVKRGIDWLPLLSEDWVCWAQRKVVICFDSDYHDNPNVCQAISDLGAKLEKLGAHVFIISLPALPDVAGKVGLDDFLTFGGPSANQAFYDMVVDAEPLGLSKPLWALNARYVYIRDPGVLYDRRDRFKTTPAAFTGHLESTSEYWRARLTAQGEIIREPVPAALAWLKWPLRTTASRMTYRPGEKEFINGELNLWSGWGVEPVKGDVSLFLKLMDHLFTDAEPGAKEWLLCWLAYPLQYPGTKLFTSVVVHGIREGTGKSLLGYTIGKIYGKNFSSIGQADLQSGFNDWACEKQFIMGDDVTGTNRFEQMDVLKKLITQQEIRINQKYVPSFTVPDCLNYYFTTNRGDSFMLADHDRRQFVHEVTAPALSEQFADEYAAKMLSAAGSAAVFHYLMNLDLKKFNPAAPALRTSAKDRMTSVARSDLGEWVRELKDSPGTVLRIGQVAVDKDLFTSKELLMFYDPDGKTRTTANGVARELARAGIGQVLGGRPVRISDGSQSRYYAIRNPETWEKVKEPRYVVEHLDGQKTGVKKKKF